MKKILTAVALLSFAFAASAQTVASETTQLPDGTTETRVPKIEKTCEATETDKLLNAAIGAGAGYLVGKGGSRAANASNQDLWGIGGAVVGALAGSKIQNTRICEKVVGYTVIRSTKDGKTTTTFEAVR
jgi:uncharacterized protein YcfJ